MAADREPGPEELEPDTVEVPAVAREQAAEARRWIKALVPLLECYSREPQRGEAAQDALDSTLIAVCARIRRLVRSDLGPGDGR